MRQEAFSAPPMQADVPKVSSRTAAEQEFREAYINCKLARHWASAVPWAALDFVGVAFPADDMCAAHQATYEQVRAGFMTCVETMDFYCIDHRPVRNLKPSSLLL